MRKFLLIVTLAGAVLAALAAAKTPSETADAVKSLFVENGLCGASYDAQTRQCTLRYQNGTSITMVVGE